MSCNAVQLEAGCPYMQAAGQHCILVTRGEETGQCNVILCDAIGTPVDSNATVVEPLCLTMTSTHVVAASGDTVFVWLYSAASGEAMRDVLPCTVHAIVGHCYVPTCAAIEVSWQSILLWLVGSCCPVAANNNTAFV